MDFTPLVDKALRLEPLSREEARAVVTADDADVLDLVAAVGRVRRRYFANQVKLNYLVNLKSGLCPEDCNYCSQAAGAESGALTYNWLSPTEAAEAAKAGLAGGARRVCLVASGRGPSERDMGRVTETIHAIKDLRPDVEVCACLGLLQDGQAGRLHEAGADAYNHNLNTAEANYADVCSTHTYSDRKDTVDKAKTGGLSACSGLICGMGESDEELVDVVFALKEIGSDSIPVNFLLSFDGTPLAGRNELTPQRCLKILAMVRLVCPDREVRMAAGREEHLRTLQPLGLHLANSMFLGDYLTSEGQAGRDDLRMILDGGFEVLGMTHAELVARATVLGKGPEAASTPARGDHQVRLRRRGAGTDFPANA